MIKIKFLSLIATCLVLLIPYSCDIRKTKTTPEITRNLQAISMLSQQV